MQETWSGPRTEADLLTVVPGTNQPGVFPRDLLGPGERVLFETRPSLFGLYWGRLVVLALLVLLFAYVAAGLPANPFGWFCLGLFLILMIYYVLKWRSTAYALTHRRVLRVSGVRQPELLDALFWQIQNLRNEPGVSGGIKFDATPLASPTGVLGGRKYAKTIYWDALPDSAQVYAFVQQAFAVESALATIEASREELVARTLGDRIPCAYCGTLVDPTSLDRRHPRCPSCGAPILAGEGLTPDRPPGSSVPGAPSAPSSSDPGVPQGSLGERGVTGR